MRESSPSEEIQMIEINEIYSAPQGEGRMLGVPSVFIRTHRCPVHCSWCDTPYTWDKSESGYQVAVDDLVAQVIDDFEGINHVVWTGGEPLVQKALPYAIRKLSALGYSHEIETSAAILPRNIDEWIGLSAHFNLSPKLQSAEPKIKPDASILRRFYDLTESSFKLVIKDDDDLVEALELLSNIGNVEKSRVILMPCGTTRDEISSGLRWLIPKAIKLGFRVTTRMHVTAFGELRGK